MTVVTSKPKVVCLCGSTKFKDELLAVARRQTLLGHIVLLPLVFSHSDPGGQAVLGPDVVAGLQALHLRKIDLADEVLAVCPQGYCGEGLEYEMTYAKSIGKPLRVVGLVGP